MQTKKIGGGLILIGCLILLAMIDGAALSLNRSQAAGAAVASAIGYQGYLSDDQGNPLTGSHQFKFELYNAPSGGGRLWLQSYGNVPVTDGLVDLTLDVDAADFTGQALWLAVTVDGRLLSPRQELLPAPYALSVRPGASIVGNTAGPALSVHNDNHVGLWASSDNEAALVGQISNQGNEYAAVAALSSGSGPALFAVSRGNDTADLMLGGTLEQDDGLLTSDLKLPSSDIIIASNDAVVIALDDDADEDGQFVVVNGDNEVTFISDEDGNTTVKGDLTVDGALQAPACVTYGPITENGWHYLPVPPFCIDEFCWIITEGDARFNEFFAGIYWPVLYKQRSDNNEWVGGPSWHGSLDEDFKGLSHHGSGLNGDTTQNLVAPSGMTDRGARLLLWDDGGNDISPEFWSLNFNPQAGDLTSVIYNICPMGRPQ